MDSIRLKTKELLTYYCGCHGNLVTLATRFDPDAYSGCHGSGKSQEIFIWLKSQEILKKES